MAVTRVNGTDVKDGSVANADLANMATATVKGRKTGSTGAPEDCTLSEILDFIGSAAQGDILYRGSSGWARLAAGTSGKFLKTQGAAANPMWDAAGGSGATLARKTADESSSDATLQNDDHLSFSIAASEEWVFDIWLVSANLRSAVDFKCAVTVPSGATMRFAAIAQVDGWDVALSQQVPSATASTSGGAMAILLGANMLSSVIHIQGWVLNSTNSGTVQLQWAENTSGQDLTILKGSYLIAHKIA